VRARGKVWLRSEVEPLDLPTEVFIDNLEVRANE